MMPSGGDSGEGSERPIGRRSCLKAAGVALGASALLGGRGRAAPSRVNVVEAGADPTGKRRCDDVLRREAGDGVHLVFPEGRYLVGDLRFEYDDYGLVAAPGASPVLVPPGDMGEEWLTLDGGNITVEGFTFDIWNTGDGGRLMVRAQRGDLTVRDVRFEGRLASSAFRFDVDDPNGQGLVERAIARDGAVGRSDGFGMYMGRDHAGVLTVRNCEIEGFPNNGLYASDPGYPGGGMGEVHVEGGLYKNNNIANVRLGTPGSYADGVTVVVDERPPSDPGRGQNARGIRLDETGGLAVRNSTVRMGAGDYHTDGALVITEDAGACTVTETNLEVDNGRYGIHVKGGAGRLRFERLSVTGTDAGDYPIETSDRDCTFTDCCTTFDTDGLASSGSCPVRGGGDGDSGGGGGDLSNVLTIATDERVPYEFSVSGDIEKSTANDATIDAGDSVADSTATGRVWGGCDSYTFSGELTAFSKRGRATVTVNGEPMMFATDESDENGGGGDGGGMHTLTIESGGPKVPYEFAVSGRLHKSGARGATFDRADAISGSSVAGQVWGGRDSYVFSGDLTDFSKRGAATVYLDDEVVDPAEL